MNNDCNDKRKSQERRGQDEPREQTAHGGGEADHHRDESERKPSPIERREWRGSGVCGDRHTD